MTQVSFTSELIMREGLSYVFNRDLFVFSCCFLACFVVENTALEN